MVTREKMAEIEQRWQESKRMHDRWMARWNFFWCCVKWGLVIVGLGAVAYVMTAMWLAL